MTIQAAAGPASVMVRPPSLRTGHVLGMNPPLVQRPGQAPSVEPGLPQITRLLVPARGQRPSRVTILRLAQGRGGTRPTRGNKVNKLRFLFPPLVHEASARLRTVKCPQACRHIGFIARRHAPWSTPGAGRTMPPQASGPASAPHLSGAADPTAGPIRIVPRANY